jgi:trans-aconitate methyltransferase
MQLPLVISRRERGFTPAVPLLWTYDLIVAGFTRERNWRTALLQQVDAREGDVIADIGCGTGSLLALLGKSLTTAKLIGIDPDSRILVTAGRKLIAAGIRTQLHRGYLREAATILRGTGTNKIVSSLVFHQVPLSEKRAGLAAIFSALGPNGELHIADYGLQRTRLMRCLFKTVQYVDGYEDTQPNAEGILPTLMREAGFANVEENSVIATLTGSISLYRGVRSTHRHRVGRRSCPLGP